MIQTSILKYFSTIPEPIKQIEEINDTKIDVDVNTNCSKKNIQFYFQKILPVTEINKDECRIEVYTDGSSIGNGKKNCKASWAFIIYENDNCIERRYGLCTKENVGYDIQSNQKAELLAIYKSIIECNQRYQCYTTIYIYSDSLYSIKCITDWSNKWTITDWDEKKNTLIIRNIKDGIKKHNYIFIHIRGHQDKSLNKHHIRNCIVDKETKKAFK